LPGGPSPQPAGLLTQGPGGNRSWNRGGSAVLEPRRAGTAPHHSGRSIGLDLSFSGSSLGQTRRRAARLADQFARRAGGGRIRAIARDERGVAHPAPGPIRTNSGTLAGPRRCEVESPPRPRGSGAGARRRSPGLVRAVERDRAGRGRPCFRFWPETGPDPSLRVQGRVPRGRLSLRLRLRWPPGPSRAACAATPT